MAKLYDRGTRIYEALKHGGAVIIGLDTDRGRVHAEIIQTDDTEQNRLVAAITEPDGTVRTVDLDAAAVVNAVAEIDRPLEIRQPDTKPALRGVVAFAARLS